MRTHPAAAAIDRHATLNGPGAARRLSAGAALKPCNGTCWPPFRTGLDETVSQDCSHRKRFTQKASHAGPGPSQAAARKRTPQRKRSARCLEAARSCWSSCRRRLCQSPGHQGHSRRCPGSSVSVASPETQSACTGHAAVSIRGERRHQQRQPSAPFGPTSAAGWHVPCRRHWRPRWPQGRKITVKAVAQNLLRISCHLRKTMSAGGLGRGMTPVRTLAVKAEK